MTDIYEREVEYKFFKETFPELLHSKNKKTLSTAMRYGLTATQRETLLMYYLDRKRPSQIARERGVHPSTVTRTINRARRNLFKAARFMGSI